MNIVDENNQQTSSPVGNDHDITKANSCTIVITDPPSGLDLGIDCMHYETGPNFKGFCQVPEGLHFIYHSTGMGARQGFFLDCRRGEIVILRWDKGNEEISLEHDLPDGARSALHQAIFAGELDKNLGPYPYTQLHLWHNVSGFLTHRVLDRADCRAGSLIYPGDAEDISKQLKTQKEMQTQAMVPHFGGLARVARFVNVMEIDLELKKAQKNPPDITSYCLEKSELLKNLICNHYSGSWEDLLGEIQLSFLLFLLIYSYPALEHWKYLVHTISLCEKYLITNPKFSSAFFRIFYEQLNFSPTDFFETELSRDNFLRPVLSNLLIATDVNVHENCDKDRNKMIDATLYEHRKRFVNFIRKKFSLFDRDASAEFGGSAFDLMEEDYPVIVNSVDNTVDEGDSANDFHNGNIFEQTIYSPISVDMFGDQDDATDTSESQRELSRHEIDVGLYCWRYPSLYAAMQTGEDLEMAATRIVDNNQVILESIEETLNKKGIMPTDDIAKTVNEAYMFLRDELTKRNNECADKDKLEKGTIQH